MKNKKTCVIYCRQSAVQQSNSSSIKNQEETLVTIADKRKLEIKKIFESLGKDTKIKELIEWISQNKVDYIITMGIDRLSRHQSDLGQIIDLMKEKKLKGIITLGQEFDQKDQYSILILGMSCDFTRETMSQRIKRGLQAKKNK
ncbi:MAG: recombinase family protein [Candidatus Shapirobacteria bacterium]